MCDIFRLSLPDPLSLPLSLSLSLPFECLALYFCYCYHRIYVTLYGNDHVDVAKVTNNYATLLQELGENEEALFFYEKALSMLKKLRGEYNPQVLSILDNLSSLFRDMNLFDDALDVDAQADVIQQRLLLRVDHKNGTSNLIFHNTLQVSVYRALSIISNQIISYHIISYHISYRIFSTTIRFR